jgi:hypothetical protein
MWKSFVCGLSILCSGPALASQSFNGDDVYAVPPPAGSDLIVLGSFTYVAKGTFNADADPGNFDQGVQAIGNLSLVAELDGVQYRSVPLFVSGVDFRYNSAGTVQSLPFELFLPVSSFAIGLGKYAGSEFTLRLFVDASDLKVEGIFGTVNEFSGSARGEIDVLRLVLPEQPAVPEPATWAMMIGGFALAGGALRRRPAARTGGHAI